MRPDDLTILQQTAATLVSTKRDTGAMTNKTGEQATSADTVTVMIGSYLNVAQLLTSGVTPGLIANGDVGLDSVDDDMAYYTYRSSYENNIVTQLASAWTGSGSGTQETTEYSGISTGTVNLTNTTTKTIYLPAQGALMYATDGKSYETLEAPTNVAWTNNTSQTGSGYYAVAPSATITVPIEATFQGDDAGSDAAGSIVTSSIAGLTVSQPTALTPGGNYTNPESNNLGGWLTNNFGNYTYVYKDQGLAPAEAHVNVNAGISWTAGDVASWDGYVDNSRAVGILNVAPLESGAAPNEDPVQPFATSAFYAGIRSAALYGGGLEIELPSYYWSHVSSSIQQTVIEEIRWCAANGLRSSILVNSQTDFAGDPDPNFAADTIAMLKQLEAEDALPSQVVLENDNGTDIGYYFDSAQGDVNSLNAVALDVANDFTLTPSASEDGLEVKGTSSAQTTLIMTGVKPAEDVTAAAERSFAPYAVTQVFSENPTKVLTLTVTDTTGLLALSDSLNGASTGAGGTLTFTGVAAQATSFLNELSADTASGTVGVANLQLTLTDYLNDVTVGTTSVYVGEVHPTFTGVTETGSVSGSTVHTGETVTFTLSTSAPVTVNGAPTLLLTNERFAVYVGEDAKGDLLFSYAVQAGDDTEALRVRGLRLNGSTITDSNGLAIDPDSIDTPAEAMASPLAVDTKVDSIVNVSEVSSASGTLSAGGEVTFLLSANNPITTVNGTPTLLLNDGGTATYAGLTNSGQLIFTYAVPLGGTWTDLAPSSSYLNGATLTNDLGEPVDPPYTLPAPISQISYNATGGGALDTLVVALSADEFLGDADAIISVDGKPVSSLIDVAAVHSEGQVQLVTVTGNFGSGPVNVGVSFTNDAWGGNPASDRNLYINGMTYNGVSEGSSKELYVTSTVTSTIAAATQNELQLWVNEDQAGGNAMFSVDVDGKLLPSTYSTDVAHSSGQWQEIDIYGDFGYSAHTVTVTFLNNAWAGSTPRLLYVEKVALNGVSANTINQTLYVTGASTTVTLAAPTDTISNVAESGSAPETLAAGDDVTFLLSANQAISTVNGTPTLTLNDGGTATYAGLNSSGQMEFTYALPSGGTWSNLAATSLNASGTTITNNLGEAVNAPGTLPTSSNELSYDATNPDTLVIALSADEYLGDAEAVVTVNGQQITSPIDVSAIHSEGQTQLVTVTGNFGSGLDQLGISFTNDAWGGTWALDRNLYVDGVIYDGQTEVDPSELATTSTLTAPIGRPADDKLQLWVSEDAAGGNAEFSVSVNGNLLSGTYSTDVAHSSGQWQEVDIYGNFGSGSHTVTATFLNNQWVGSTPRLLYVEKAAIDGVSENTINQTLYATGSTTTVTIPAPAIDTLTLELSEDAWQGNAECYVTIDGKMFGGVTTVTASHSSGAEQTMTIEDAGLSTGTHTIGLAFINDAWGGSLSQDRNLYLNGAQLNGVDQHVSAALMTPSTAVFRVGQSLTPGVTMEGASSLLSGLTTSVTPGIPTQATSASSGIANLQVHQSTAGSTALLMGHT